MGFHRAAESALGALPKAEVRLLEAYAAGVNAHIDTLDERDALQTALLARGIDTQRTWMDACDSLEAFSTASGGTCEVARSVGSRALYLPTYAALEERQIDAVVHAVRAEVGG